MKKIWIGVFILTALIALVFSGKAAGQIWTYVSLDSKAVASIEKWQVIEKGSSSFAIEASYRFSYLEKEFSGVTEFAPPYFLNETAASLAIKKISSQEFFVFFNKTHPERSSLQRIFPFLRCIHAFLTLGVFVYFIFLKKWLKKSFV